MSTTIICIHIFLPLTYKYYRPIKIFILNSEELCYACKEDIVQVVLNL